ncbi:hypothetical protein BY996DRAFT_7913301 [Phakopsora pachyrhizi]|nr:hypothetical protein BY996DRAFT_7913301 [Phakopsora pachyrhizi]
MIFYFFRWTEVYGNNHYLWQAAYWWFGNLIAIAAALLPKLAYKYIQAIYYPRAKKKVERSEAIASDDMERRESEIGAQNHELIRSRTSLTHDMATGQLSPSSGRGFNFDQADGVGEIAVGNRLRRYNTSLLSKLRFIYLFIRHAIDQS